jgi:hypothetical protein
MNRSTLIREHNRKSGFRDLLSLQIVCTIWVASKGNLFELSLRSTTNAQFADRFGKVQTNIHTNMILSSIQVGSTTKYPEFTNSPTIPYV